MVLTKVSLTWGWLVGGFSGRGFHGLNYKPTTANFSFLFIFMYIAVNLFSLTFNYSKGCVIYTFHFNAEPWHVLIHEARRKTISEVLVAAELSDVC